MIFSLFLKECKILLKSITYYVCVILCIIMFVTQMGEFETIPKPEEGKDDYGITISKDKNDIVSCAMGRMEAELGAKEFGAYPFGFYKGVRLNEKETKRMEEILEEVKSLQIPEEFSKFEELMKEASKVVGRGSYYSKSSYMNMAIENKTYEEALKDHESYLSNDKISRANARLFCDYMGIILAIVPVFLVTARILQDKRAKVSQVLYAKQESTIWIVLSRFGAMVVMLLIPLLLLGINPLLQCMYYGDSVSISVDMFAFVKYTLGWLLPTIMVVTALVYLITELTESPAAIFVQVIWWIGSVFSGALLRGVVGWNLIPRFNELGAYEEFKGIFQQLIMNRMGYTVFSLVLIILVIIVIEKKRKGGIIVGRKGLRNRKSQLEA